MLVAVASCLVAALVAAPTAGAAAASNASAAPKAQSAQSKKKLARDIRTIRRRTNAVRSSVRTLRTTLSTLETSLRAAITGGDKTIDDKINGIVATVTPVLTQIVENLTKAGNGLVALEAGVKELASKTTAGFATVEENLTDIGDFLGATEYGFAQLAVVQPGPVIQPQGGSFVVTPDIPDTVQQAMTHQEFLAQHAGNLAVVYGVRSGENDGTGATNPAAHCRVRVTNEAGTTEVTAPNAALNNLPFQAVPEKSTLTSTNQNNAAFPFGLKQNDNGAGEADNTTTFVTSVPVAAGDQYEVEMSCVDLSPDADDPEA